MRPIRLLAALGERPVVVVPGFLGVGAGGTIASLGRGGSDLTAVLLAVAIRASACELIKDVPGYHTADPHRVPEARPIRDLVVDERRWRWPTPAAIWSSARRSSPPRLPVCLSLSAASAPRPQSPSDIQGAHMEFATRTIHAGQPSEPETGALIAPIFQTSTYEQEEPGLHRGFDYSRTNNPTRARLEAVLADLEGCEHAAVFGSGLAAENAVLQAYLRPGDEVVIPLDVYGGTYRILNSVFQPLGCVIRQIDFGSSGALAAALSSRTKLVWIESPTNPRLLVYDIAAIAAATHAAGALLVVDNTFATPLFPAAVFARRRPGGAQRDEVSRRPLGCDSRRGPRPRCRGVRAGQVPAECDRARCLRRSTAGSRCAVSRRSSCGCSGTPKTPTRSPAR